MARKGIGGHHRPYRGASDVWLTPPEVVAALGPFDLDPCGCEESPFQYAPHLYTVAGLDLPWLGRVFLNPPYGPEVGKWLAKLADHGRGTAIVFARTETAWFHRQVWERATACLFLEGRLHFHRADGVRAKHNAGGPSVLVAYGQDDAERLQRSGIKGRHVWLVPNY